MKRATRTTLKYEGGQMDGESITLLVSDGTVGVTVERQSAEGRVRENYVVVRSDDSKRTPLRLMYTDTVDMT